jgi:nucleoside-diphosphate-sugar epimerase
MKAMKVLVTGATGLVGSHAVAALQRAGHRIRVLVRDERRVQHALGPLGALDVEVVTGDVTNVCTVRAALTGCDAVVHAAALYSLDPRRDAEVQRTNVRGTEHVLGCARELGLDPIIHVSSISALLPTEERLLGRNADVSARPIGAYGRSKADAERTARRLQEQGAPVVSFYPGAVWGPHDPTVGEGVEVVIDFLRQTTVPITPGGMTIVDARDLGRAIAAATVSGKGPRRFMAGGHWVTPSEMADLFEAITGRTFRRIRVPQSLIRVLSRAGDLATRWLGVDVQITREAAETMFAMLPSDDSPLFEELGVRLRPARETLVDTLRWAFETGRLSEREAGRLALAPLAAARIRAARKAVQQRATTRAA